MGWGGGIGRAWQSLRRGDWLKGFVREICLACLLDDEEELRYFVKDVLPANHDSRRLQDYRDAGILRTAFVDDQVILNCLQRWLPFTGVPPFDVRVEVYLNFPGAGLTTCLQQRLKITHAA